MNITYDFPPPQPKNKYVAIDLEIFGMNKKTLHRPTSGTFACMTIATEPDEVYITEHVCNIETMLKSISDCIWVFHHSQFDLTQLRRWTDIFPRNKLWDTLLIERILWGGYFSLFGLDQLARRYLDIKVDKSLQKSWEKATEITPELLEYAATDASITLQICEAQRKIMTKDDFKIWSEVDRPALWSILDFKGMAIDVDGWLSLAKSNKERAEEIDKQLSFNPNSPKQVVTNLTQLGFKGLPNSQEGTLETFIKKFPKSEAARLSEMILERRAFGKRASTYGANFISDHLEQDNEVNIIMPDWHIIGAESGRMSCSEPNLQNIPARETKDFRKCFIARPGNKIIVVDYSAQEPRITAYLTQDKKLMSIFQSGKDIYCEMAREIFGETIEKSDPRRAQMKSLILGAIYGLSKWGLSKKENIDVETAEELLNHFFRLFSGIKAWADKQQRNKKLVRTVMGRKCWLNPYSSQVERNALNFSIQGTAGDMTKRALGLIHKDWNFPIPFGLVAVIHDEIVADIPEQYAHDVAQFISAKMIEAADAICPGNSWKAEYAIGENWSIKN